MGLETYQVVLIVIVVVFIVGGTILAIVKKRRSAKMNQTEIRSVSTIQRVYYEPAKYTQYPPNPTNNVDGNNSTPGMLGWNLTNLDGPSSSVNIQQQQATGVVIQRDPVMLSQPGYPPYPVYEPNTTQGYGQPPPYNPNFAQTRPQ